MVAFKITKTFLTFIIYELHVLHFDVCVQIMNYTNSEMFICFYDVYFGHSLTNGNSAWGICDEKYPNGTILYHTMCPHCHQYLNDDEKVQKFSKQTAMCILNTINKRYAPWNWAMLIKYKKKAVNQNISQSTHTENYS